jgi:asparagine synthase (glutamine-hydrolysing)
MSAISGIWRLDGRPHAELDCLRLVQAQRAYGDEDQRVQPRGSLAFGRNLHRTVPEDRYDVQPVSGGSGRFLLVADLRIDNRAELLHALALPSPSPGLADSGLLMAALERWGEDVVDRLSGDFAFAAWDNERQELILARDPTGQRPLHFHRNDKLVAFASMPRALFALPEIPAELDQRRLAELVADLRPPADKTFYKHVDRVPTGHVVRIGRAASRMRRYWNPPLRQLRLRNDADYVEAFRERVDHAVAARLRGAEGLVATHLSAGYDSGTVTATAARLSGGRVLAFTAAPRLGYSGEVPRGRIADETPYAAMTAAPYGNIEHVIVRPEGRSQLDLLDQSHSLAQYPAGQLSNNLYWTAINQEASRRGAGVLLTGQVGNHSLSAAGLMLLADLIRERQVVRWWREARQVVAKSPARWRGVLANSFGPWLPRPVWVQINARLAGGSSKAHRPHLLTERWAAEIDNSHNPGRDTVPPRDSYAMRRTLLQSVDPGTHRKGSLAGFGIDERDPTADRQLIEFCLSLPPDQLLKDGVTRPLARRALADRLPGAILNDGPRGYQMPDWNEALRLEEVRKQVELVAASPTAASIIDVGRLRQMVDDWPTGDWNSPRVVMEYRFRFLIALSVAHFIRSFEATDFRAMGKVPS